MRLWELTAQDSYVDLTQTMTNAHDILYPSKDRTIALVRVGEYYKYLDAFTRSSFSFRLMCHANSLAGIVSALLEAASSTDESERLPDGLGEQTLGDTGHGGLCLDILRKHQGAVFPLLTPFSTISGYTSRHSPSRHTFSVPCPPSPRRTQIQPDSPGISWAVLMPSLS